MRTHQTETLRPLLGAVSIAAVLAAAVATAGAYEIGHTRTLFVDPARGNRPIDTDVYYPADLPGEDVPVAAAPPGGFPVIAFGHGFLIPATDYDFVWEGLTPAGYVLCLPRTEGSFSPNHLALGLDLAFLCLRLQAAGADPGSPFHGRIGARCAVSGHSMGGGASFLGAAAETGISALFNLAAAETNPSAVQAAADITVPALVLAGSLDCVTPPAQHQQPLYAALASDCRAYVELTGASHCQFAEYNLVCNLGEGGCPAPAITRQAQHDLTLAVALPWLDFVLRGELQGWETFLDLLATHGGITHLLDCPAAGVSPRGPVASPPSVPVAALGHACPNPAVGRVSIAFRLPQRGRATLSIADATGRCVRRLMLAAADAGWQQVEWDGADDAGWMLPAGCYFCRLDSPHALERTRILLLR